ncbi:MAG: hypothetical protein KKG06_10955 [Bacteroidetes bacterium]|nr:hypothetical protein [Bacteroidota bacterium]MBU1423674.1 hypothetical protein [Bacteroidota bacterium]
MSANNTSAAILEQVTRSADLFLYDLKTLDDAAHKNFTGVSSSRQTILKLLEKCCS